MRRLIVLLVIVLAIIPGGIVSAQREDSIDRQAQEIYGNIMSPFCPGRLLRDCPSAAAGELKDKIALDLASGISPVAITQELIKRYGDQVRAVPAHRGIGELAWWLPLLFLLAGFLLVLSWLRLHKGSRHEEQSTPLDPAIQRRIDKELE